MGILDGLEAYEVEKETGRVWCFLDEIYLPSPSEEGAG